MQLLEGRVFLSAEPFPGTLWGAFPSLIHQDLAVQNFPKITGAGETVVLIDSGVDTNHPALAGKIAGGYNYIDNNTNLFVGGPDNNPHATGVAGVIAANPYIFNGRKFQGIAPGVKLLVLKQDSSQQVKKALDWVIQNATAQKIVAVNITDFLGASFTPTIYASQLDTLYAMGVFIASPTGNKYPDPIEYPAADPTVAASAAVGLDDQIWAESQRGPALDMLAPGHGVTLPYYDVVLGKSIYTNAAEGTSWTAPHITATAALLKQINPAFTPRQIMQIMQDSGREIYDSDTGFWYPRLDLNAALELGTQRAKSGWSSTPFFGSAWDISQPLTLANFDGGGKKIAYSDLTAGNQGNTYRTDVDVDTSRDGSGHPYVGWTQPKEWMNYTIAAPTGGTYRIDTSVASNGGGGKFSIIVDGTSRGTFAVPNTGDWNTYGNVAAKGIFLTPGVHRVRLLMVGAGAGGWVGNFSTMKFTLAKPLPAGPFSGTPINVPGQIEVENFDNGGEGVAYHDSDPANNGMFYRSGGVDTDHSAFASNGYFVGWTQTGEWLKYTVNVAQSGTYRIDFRVASSGAGGAFTLYSGTRNLTKSSTGVPMMVPDTGGWERFKTISKTGVKLSAGRQTLTLRMGATGDNGVVGNFDWFKLVRTG